MKAKKRTAFAWSLLFATALWPTAVVRCGRMQVRLWVAQRRINRIRPLEKREAASLRVFLACYAIQTSQFAASEFPDGSPWGRLLRVFPLRQAELVAIEEPLRALHESVGVAYLRKELQKMVDWRSACGERSERLDTLRVACLSVDWEPRPDPARPRVAAWGFGRLLKGFLKTVSEVSLSLALLSLVVLLFRLEGRLPWSPTRAELSRDLWVYNVSFLLTHFAWTTDWGGLVRGLRAERKAFYKFR